MSAVDRSLWQAIMQDVIKEGGNIIRPWFSSLEPVSLEHGLLEIMTPGSAERDYCQENASRLFTEAAQSATGKLVGVCFLASVSQTRPDNTGSGLFEVEKTSSSELVNDYTFDSFVYGPCNRLAYAACVAVSESPGQAYNPLFIHGDSGLGKTHLLNSVSSCILQNTPGANILYLSCEEFINHFIQAVQKGELHDFRYRYRHVDLLAIDDIQFLYGHEQSQEEFFHTFNTLYQARKQVVLSADRSPRDTSLEERLISRFNWGLVARIDSPCYETRVAILNQKALRRGIHLPEEVACYIASVIDNNARELEGAISKLTILAEITDRPISLALAEEALGQEQAPTGREVTIDDILEIVTSRYSVRLSDLQSKKRTRSIALPRQVCMYLARKLTDHSLEEIGGYFGGRDHTTVLHASRVVDSKREEDPLFNATVMKLTEDIQSRL